jgi:hypothetical protein
LPSPAKDFLPSEMVAIKRAIEPEIATPHGGSRAAPPPQLALEERKVETFHLEAAGSRGRLFHLGQGLVPGML